MKPQHILRRVCAGMLVSLCAAAAEPDEAAISAFVDAHEDAALVLLEEAVNINSGTLNAAGVRRAGDFFFSNEFKELGFNTRWVDGAPFGRAGHLVAERPGNGKHVLLIGHLDTVFEPESAFQRFERIDEHTAHGPGVTDMKGGIVIGLLALRALASVDALDDLHVTVVLNGDEEDKGAPAELARATLTAAAQAADIAIGLENADDDPTTAVTARRSSSTWELRVTGNSAHSSQIFREDIGAGAAFELARILDAFYRELHDEEYLTFNPGVLLAGSQLDFDAATLSGRAVGKNNVIVPQAVATGDLRALTVEQRERAKARMQAIVAAHLPHAGAQITFTDGYPPLAPTDGNRELLAMYDRVSRDLGLGPISAVDPRRAGAADIAFAAAHVDMAIDGLGMLGGHNHTEDEYADLRVFPVQAKRLAVLLYRLGRE